MRTTILLFTVAAALAFSSEAGAATRTINIYSFFKPGSATINAGDTVVWRNLDNENHQVLADHGQFVSPILRPHATYTFKFSAAGTYRYHDELHPKMKGVIYVKGIPPTLTFAVSQSIVTYGTQITLSGLVSNHSAGEKVTIYYKPYPQPNLIERATLLTSTGGAFEFVAEPQILTTYEATWNGVFAIPATVEVAPKLSLGRNGVWIIHAAGARTFAGKAVQLQRLNLLTGQWVTLKKALLNVHSSARVSVTLPKGMNHLRVTMSVNQAGAGYLGVTGPVLNWVQRS